MLRQVLLSRPRRPSHSDGTDGFGVYQDVFWIDSALARKGKKVIDEEGLVWTVEETYGVKDMQYLVKQSKVVRDLEEKLQK